METIVKTSIKGNENIHVTESVTDIFNKLAEKNSFILLNSVSFDKKKSKIIIKKTSIKLVKEK